MKKLTEAWTVIGPAFAIFPRPAGIHGPAWKLTREQAEKIAKLVNGDAIELDELILNIQNQ